MRELSLLLVLWFVGLLHAQDFSMHDEQYANKFNYKVYGKERVVRTYWNYVVSEDTEGNFVLRVFYPEKELLTKYMTFADEELNTPHGTLMTWWDNGSLRTKGAFTYGEETGNWEIATFQGSKEIGPYEHGHKEGTWKEFNNEGELTARGVYVLDQRHGRWDHYDKGKVERVYNYRNGKKHNWQISYDTASTCIDSSLYHEGEFQLRRSCVSKDGDKKDNVRVDTIVEQMPCFIGKKKNKRAQRKSCQERLFAYLASELTYPKSLIDLGISGTAYMTFVVNEEGQVTEIEALSGVCADMEAECRRILTNMPAWRPGTQRRKPVKVSYNLPLKFSLR